jgi:post-segregation antitoxin (ccd killing protein)
MVDGKMKERRPIYSITIDDDLVNRAKALAPEKNFSQIVREALEFYIRRIELRNEVEKEVLK